MAIVMRELQLDGHRLRHEVLAANGKWREKSDADMIFEDEKLPVEEV